MNDINFKTLINKHIPVNGSQIFINKIDLNKLLYIYNWSSKEVQEKMTCRPIINRNRDESIKLYNSLLNSDTVYIFGLYNLNNKELLGKITLFDYNSRNKSLEIGYYLLPDFRKKGYMNEAIKLILNLLFSKIDINKVYAQTASFNNDSNALLKLNNFKLDGVLREHHELNEVFYDDYIYSILRSEFILSI
ncbi:N-acetyltransferase [Clostridium botulinum]|uniref:GNAT family N-acetyltransferase n=1 Tax=Clostridium sp. ZBS20 TaxID=2949966 RepID=UPI00207B04D5|nr:GNAT family protein [Clostridium sp. ZBS20]MBN1051271.1 N-acetyltransferase [Clostridium botulinum]